MSKAEASLDSQLSAIRDLTERLTAAAKDRAELSALEAELLGRIRIASLTGDDGKAAQLQSDLNAAQKKLWDLGKAIEQGEENLQRLKTVYAGQKAIELRGSLKEDAKELEREIDKVFSDLTSFIAGYDRLINLANKCGTLAAEYENTFANYDATYIPIEFRIPAKERFGVRDEFRRLLMRLPADQQSTWGKLVRDLAR